MSLAKLLVIDDEKNIGLVLEAMLQREGFEVSTFTEPRKALQALQKETFHGVITDLQMPDLTGMDVLEHCKQNYPELPVIFITAYGTVESAVAAVKKGAFDFISKPFDQTELVATVCKAVLSQQKNRKEPQAASGVKPLLIGKSVAISDVYRIIQKIAESPSTVLIQGESGTGKELVAMEIHRHSLRRDKPLIRINCSAIPATLIESELFGYERGAFTGAVNSKPGRFELAHEGTLFLDEVAEMPLEMQVKLLRAIQEQEFERVGGLETKKVDVRLITATNKNLEAEVKAGRFREDLFYRLNVVPIHLPTLRERIDDIPILVDHFIQKFNEKMGKAIQGIEQACLQRLQSLEWPGNIRQLENAVERMMVLGESDILRLSDLPTKLNVNAGHGDVQQKDELDLKAIVKKQTQMIERDLIERALEETSGNVTRAAEKLGLSRKGLQLKLKELGIRRSDWQDELGEA